jgi:hypothetical protein
VNKSDHSIQAEMQMADAIWAAWYTGHYLAVNNLFTRYPVITRLILLDRNSAMIGQIAASLEIGRAIILQEITDTTERACKAGIEVRWYDGPLTPMVIGSPSSPNRTWARVGIPISASSQRPSFVANRAASPVLVDEIKSAYERMWKASRPAERESILS